MSFDAGIKIFNLPDVHGRDFSAHNAERDALWKAFDENKHERVPIILGCNPRILMLDPRYNTSGLTYEEYMWNSELMAQAILEFQYWTRFFLPGDHEKGLPDKWVLWIDFENHYDAAWFGCPVHYRDGQVPDTTPILREDNKRMLFDRGLPDPFAGKWVDRCLQIGEEWNKKIAEGWTFLGRPVEANVSGSFLGGDGVFTAATSIRGTTDLCIDLLNDPAYARELLEFVHEAMTNRIAAWRKRFDVPVPQENFGSADDAIEMLSLEQYREFVLPLHRRFYDQFAAPKNRSIHLCGDDQRHFKTIHDQLGVVSFDTGFPVDFAKFRKEMGPDVQIAGGPTVSFFMEHSPEALIRETKRILKSGVLKGGRFILREGNNLPPGANIEVCRAFYETGKQFGKVKLKNEI